MHQVPLDQYALGLSRTNLTLPASNGIFVGRMHHALHGDVSTVAALNKQILCFRRELKGSPIAAIRVAGYSDRGTSCRGARG